MKKVFLTMLFLLTFSPAFAEEYLDVTPDYHVKFPDDFYYKKGYRIQWWYFTGHLFDEEGREFGYEITFFVVGLQEKDYQSKFGLRHIFISHFAISDVEGKKFFFMEKADRGAFDFAGAKDKQLKVWVGKSILEGAVKKMHIKAVHEDTFLSLLFTPDKPIVLHGEEGYSRKSEESPLIASIYFSYTNLKTEGTLRIDNRVFRLQGKSWFDREISSKGLGEKQIGWDWFAIQLDDNREIMLYEMRKRDGSIDQYSSGTFVYRDGKYRHLSKDAFNVRVLGTYTSKKTGATYPSKWEITIPSENINLKIVPLLKDQEFIATYSTGNYYWEGTCKVEGTAKGRAYVEMVGY